VRPAISVVLPVRDGGEYLEAAVQSILAQTFSDLELILVDDHSTDSAISRLPKDDSRLNVLASKGEGIVAALNTGLKHATGDYLARMDADDISLPGRLELQYNYLTGRPDIDIAGAKVEIFSSKTIAGGFRRYQEWVNSLTTPEHIHNEIFIECPLPHPTLFMRREVIMNLTGYRDAAWAEDYDLLLRADAAGMHMGKPDGVLLRWRDHDHRLTRTDQRYSIENFLSAKIRFLTDTRILGREVVIWGAGPTGKFVCDALSELEVRVRAFLEVHPRRIGGGKRGLPVYHFDQVTKFSNVLVLVAVGVASARADIRKFLIKSGKLEGTDFLFVA